MVFMSQHAPLRRLLRGVCCIIIIKVGGLKIFRKYVTSHYAPAPWKLTFDLLTLKVVSESHVTWAISVPILVLLALSVIELDPTFATRRRQTRIIA